MRSRCVVRGVLRRLRTYGLGLGVALVIAMGMVACTRAPEPTAWESHFDSADGWQLSSDPVADVSVVEGRLVVHVMAPGQVAWAASQGAWQDGRIAVDATQVSGPVDNEYGILLRMEDDHTFAAFSVSGDGYVRAARYTDGEWSILGPDWMPSEAINQGAATNHLEVVAQGPQVTFWVNDQQVLQTEDVEVRSGPVGLYAGAFSEGDVVVAFDDFRITPVP